MLPSPTSWHRPQTFFPVLDMNPSPFASGSASTSPVSTVPAAEAAISVAVQRQEEEEEDEEEQKSSILATTKTRKARRQLPTQASSVLKEFYDNVSTNPTLSQRKELLSCILTIPGAEWYSREHLARWFAWRRKSRSKASDLASQELQKENKTHVSETRSITTANILWPSLDVVKIAKLVILQRETPHPSDDVLQVWSRALKAEKDDIHNWVQLNGLKDQTPVKSLPTPGPSHSPDLIHSKLALHSPTQRFADLPPLSPVEKKPLLSPLDIKFKFKFKHAPREEPIPPPPDDRSSGDRIHAEQAFWVHPCTPESFVSRSPASIQPAPALNPEPASAVTAESPSYHPPETPLIPLPQPFCTPALESACSTPDNPSAALDTLREKSVESPSIKTPELPETAKHEPRRNILAELAAFVDKQTMTATADPVAWKISLGEFNQRMQGAEAFFEKINSGAFASLGLTFHH